MDEVIDCAKLVEKCPKCGGPLDWEGDWHGCFACRDLHNRKVAEAQLHESDWLDGEPLDIGDGYSVSMHSSNCGYCALLKAKP